MGSKMRARSTLKHELNLRIGDDDLGIQLTSAKNPTVNKFITFIKIENKSGSLCIFVPTPTPLV